MDKAGSGVVRLRGKDGLKTVDYYLVVPVLAMTIIGLYVLQKVLSKGYAAYPGNYYRQIAATVGGIICALIISLLDEHFLKIIGRLIYAVSLFLLILVPIDGYSLAGTWGADSWLNLPVIGNFQPSELAKIGLIMVASDIFEMMHNKEVSLLKGYGIMAAVYAPPMLLILTQPDFGTAMVIVFTFVCMMFAWGVRYRYFLLAFSTIVVVVLPAVWYFYLEAYQKDRILSLVFQGSDPRAEYNLLQSQHAIASGGLTGNHTGILTSVPVKESDFIFAAISEHMGFIGTTTVIILAFFFLCRCLFVASKVPSKSASYMLTGLTSYFAFHYIENMGMSVGLLPITGIPLPFISLGGTAMLINYLAFGVILNISMSRKS
ncbi:FtsW/RodA/SpoVE family cell cycle protein [Butyrivibrio sp. AE2032]|uniref:FtsW/RodA/SpoVE family cell cycle protein n=1 Tax=Butyrivibrio sp. AE2032 TaxID=1458463 RepID=UPI00054F20EF|nr:FtsW/RodA/SpoVE family cell cycle protein [Butyrivibrio sp. AE2032]